MPESRKTARPKRTVGKGASKQHPWFPIFIGSVMAVALSALALFAVLVRGADGSNGPGSVDGATAPMPTKNGGALTPNGGNGSQLPTPSATDAVTPGPNDPGDDPSPLVRCGDMLAPVDKEHRLAHDCEPADLQPLPGSMSYGGQQLLKAEAAAALQELFAAASKDGFRLYATSSYRSYQQQVVTFQQNVAQGGLAYALRTSARAGHSEHQLGTTTDLTSASAGYSLEGFIGTPEAAWVAANSWKYGFIVSYPDGKEQVTGYAYEPWHIRYVSKDVAKRVRDSGLTLHEFLLR